MQEMRWMDHIGSIDQGIELANRLYWGITVTDAAQKWFVKSGEKAVFVADTKEAVDAFLYGLSLAYAVLPPDLFDTLARGMDDLLGEVGLTTENGSPL